MSGSDTQRHKATSPVLRQLPRLEPTSLTLWESMPGVLGFVVAISTVLLPLAGSTYLRLARQCDPSAPCMDDTHMGLRLLDTFVKDDRVPEALRGNPITV